MRVLHDILEVVIAMGVMVMFLAVLSVIDISSAKNKPKPKPPPSSKEVLFVDAASTGPSSAENGSQKHPYRTIQRAIDEAVGGQTVLVAPGVYYGTVELKSGVKLVSIAGPSVTVIDGQGEYYAVMSPYIDVPDGWIEGFTLRNASVLIDVRNRVSMWAPASMEISDCVFHDATRGITVTAGASTNIKRTVFTDLDRALVNLWNTGVVLKNVTIDKVGAAFSLYDSLFYAYNTSISRSGCVAQLRGGHMTNEVRGSNNNVCSCTVMTEPNSEGQYPDICFDVMLEENPQHVAPDSMDYHLQAASPLIDQGMDVGLPYCGASPDIGAYEFMTPGCVSPSPYSTAALPMSLVLSESYSDTTVPEYRDDGERRRNELQSTVMEVIEELAQMDQNSPVQQQVDALTAMRTTLEQEVLARADGYYGGDRSDDWITAKSEQYDVVTRIELLIQRIDRRVEALTQ